jgi:hypothetical protein
MLLPLAALALFAAQPSAPAERESYVPYAGSDGIVGFKADGARGVYIRSLTGGWYYARTANRCGRLRSATSLGFITRGSEDLDRFGAIVAEGQYCPLTSVTRSPPPPGEPRG